MTERPAQRRYQRIDRPEALMTLAEVAEAMGITAERVRKLEINALTKLRQGLEANGFKREDFFD